MIAYCDASALVKLVIAEPESEALITWLKRAETTATSALAVVEVHRAARVASPHDETARDAWGVLETCVLLEVSREILRVAAELATLRLRPLDAIHLATALSVRPDVFVAYDARLADAARARGLVVASPR